MKPAGFVRRWLTWLRIIWSKPARRVLRHDDARRRRMQQLAAREAFLSDLPTHHQRALLAPHFGDVQ
ncbi:MAG: hypothetical protein ACK4RV_11650 [Caulobacter sp.]